MMTVEQFYKKERKKFVNIISRILRGDRASAEDVVQEAFTRSIKFHASYDPTRSKFQTWFNTILFNALRDVQKEMRGQPSDTSDDLSIDDFFEEESILNSPEVQFLIKDGIASTTNLKHQRVLELFFVNGYTSTEISQIEDHVSVNNVTTIITRFRTKMKE